MPSKIIYSGIKEFHSLSVQINNFIKELIKEKKLSSLSEYQAVSSDRYRQISFLMKTIKEIEETIQSNKKGPEGQPQNPAPTIFPASILRTAMDLVCQEIYASYWIRGARNSRLYEGLIEILNPTQEQSRIDQSHMGTQEHLTLHYLKASLIKLPSHESVEPLESAEPVKSSFSLTSVWGLFGGKDFPRVSTDSKAAEAPEETAALAGPAAP